MNFRSFFTTSNFLKSVFVISLFLLLFISGVSYKNTIELTETAELLDHSYKIRIQLEQIFSYLKGAESGQRGFIISGDTVFLQSYYRANERIKESSRRIAKLVESHQQKNTLDTLIHLINLRYYLLSVSLKLNSEIPLDKIALDKNLYTGKLTMDKIRAQIQHIMDLELLYFNAHQLKYEHDILLSPIFTLLLFLFSLLIFITAFIKILQDLTLVKKTNQELIITMEAFNHAEEIGDFSSWQWYMDTDKLVYSDNQYSMLGCDPQSFEPTIENFLNYVHPDDRLIITEGVRSVLEGKEPSSAFFRIIRTDGKIRYIKSIAKLTDYHGKILIGINSDITEQYLNKLALEERNIELEESNKELAYFNHMASHDLQEPLRKIQTFISRISDKSLATMPDTIEYIEKINMSASRMRTLIDDLLIFSKTNRIKRDFEKTDLNALLENAIQELAHIIVEKNAIVNSNPLPILNVIAFQIQQLFINLIGNSLKFNRPGTPPIIEILCEKITAYENPIVKMQIQKEYYKITITDNGQGFEQIEAENIFILFHRLHSKNEYPGSGIGLAICRKIVENHNGFITAEGMPGKGSVFTIYLPS